jgi:DNA-binding NarL/FixJ family response regulator
MRVFLVDREPIFREGLKCIMSKEHDLTIVGEADNYRDLPPAAKTTDLLILDGELDSLLFLKSVQRIRAKGRPPFVLILTKHNEDYHAVQLLKAGADGYLHKTDSPEKVMDAIRKIIRGGKYVAEDLAETVILAMNGVNGPSRLSHREYEVLYLFASGMGMGEIAHHLSLSVKTISTYRARLLEKLNLRSNAQLMRYAFNKGMVT